MNRRFFSVAAILIVLCLQNRFAAVAHAQDAPAALNLISSNPVTLLTAKPGEKVTTTIKVQNAAAVKERLKLNLMRFSANATGGGPILHELTSDDDFAQWISYTPAEFDIAPEEWKTVTVTLAVPSDASFTYFPAVVFSRAEVASPEVGQASTALNGGQADLILLNIDRPGAKRELAITEFKTDKSIYSYLPVTFSITLTNTGNVYVMPRGEVFVDRGSSHDLGVIDVNPEKGNLLPGSQRVFTSSVWRDGFPVYTTATDHNVSVVGPDGQPQQTLSWNWSQISKFRIGRYTAHLLVVYNDGQRDIPLEKTISFWVLPWQPILAGLVLLGLLFFGIFSFGRGIYRRLRRFRKAAR